MTKFEPIKLTEYQNFSNVKEMDANIKKYSKHLKRHQYELLSLLARYSCKVYGVSYIRIQRIADELGKSVRAVKYAIKQLKQGGFIKIIHTVRPERSGRGASVYIINSVDQRAEYLKTLHCGNCTADEAKKTREKQRQYYIEYIITNKTNHIHKRKPFNSLSTTTVNSQHERIENIKTAKVRPQGLPERFYKLYSAYFTDKQLLRMYRLLNEKATFYATYQDGIDHGMKDEIIELSMNALIKALKRQYRYKAFTVRNIFAYVSKAADNIGFNADYYGDINRYTPAV